MKRIRVPRELAQVAYYAQLATDPPTLSFDESDELTQRFYFRICEAILRHLSEHPQLPTDEQAEKLRKDFIAIPFEKAEYACKWIAVEWQRRCFVVEEPEINEVCGACVIHFIAREGSFFPCALQKGHSGGHRAAGNCFRHGPYLGEAGAVPNCPKWPSCAEFPIAKEPEIPEEIEDLLKSWEGGSKQNLMQRDLIEAYRRGLRKGEHK